MWWLVLTVTLTRDRIAKEEIVNEGKTRIGKPMGMSVKACVGYVDWCGKTQCNSGQRCSLRLSPGLWKNGEGTEREARMLSLLFTVNVTCCCKFLLPWFPPMMNSNLEVWARINSLSPENLLLRVSLSRQSETKAGSATSVSPGTANRLHVHVPVLVDLNSYLKELVRQILWPSLGLSRKESSDQSVRSAVNKTQKRAVCCFLCLHTLE